MAAATRVTSERPALDRITMERAALIPHPRWQRFLWKITQPRWLAAIAVGAVFLGAAAIIGSEQLLSGDDGNGSATGGVAFQRSNITVSVLNASSANGLGGIVAGDLEDAGFTVGEIGAVSKTSDQTVVMFEPDRQPAAKLVANDLGGKPPLQPIDREAQQLAGGADVVVIAGEDRVEK
jgi:hypothetical protein